jgi:cobalamin synthase
MLAATAAGVAVVLGAWFRRWLGGGTGDTLGAAAELAETAALVAAAALASGA